MRINLTIVATTLALMTPIFAGTYLISNVVTGDATSDALIQKRDGSLLTGGILALGYFPDAYMISVNLADIQTTIAKFTIVAASPVGLYSVSIGAAKPGYVEADPVAGPFVTDPNPLIKRPLYVFCGDGDTLAGSSQWALKRASQQTIMDDVPFEYFYPANPKGGLAPEIGTFGTFIGDASGIAAPNARVYQTLKMVPEASTMWLGAFAACGLLRRRR